MEVVRDSFFIEIKSENNFQIPPSLLYERGAREHFEELLFTIDIILNNYLFSIPFSDAEKQYLLTK